MPMTVDAMTERKDRPAYVRFETRAVEDKEASTRDGQYRARDVDFVIVTPPYSKDQLHFRVDKWLKQNEEYVRNNRLPREWADRYKAAYEAWKKGQDLPLEGTPIKGWLMISPAQQEILLHCNILTVEDLAEMNDEGAKRVGMGAIMLKNKAKAWLSQAKDKGPATMEIANLKKQNENLELMVETLTKQVQELQKVVKTSAPDDEDRPKTKR